MRSTDGPLESAMITCPVGHSFNGPIESVTWESNEEHEPSNAEIATSGRPGGRDPCARMARDKQVHMWKCVLLANGAAPLTAASPLRWVPSLDGNRLVGSHLPTQDPSGRACNEGICDQEET